MSEAFRVAVSERRLTIGVIGLGYAGLPVACSFADAGFDVIGVDIDSVRVGALERRENPLGGDEPGLTELILRVRGTGRFRPTDRHEDLRPADVVLICVETPIDEVAHVPRYAALRSATVSLGHVLKRGALVIVESTVGPGTTSGLVRTTIEQTSGMVAEQDFFLGHCPERVMPGRLLTNLRTYSRVCGGVSAETAQKMVALYGTIVSGDLDVTDTVTAEIVKTSENAYRDVNIAFANELALIAEAHDSDVWRVRDLVNKVIGRNVLYPGVGVGGHCIPKDPWLLIANAPPEAGELTRAARAVNGAMPRHMADLVERALRDNAVSMNGASVLVLGYSYLPGSGDTRNTPSEPLVRELRARGCEVLVHDPYVPQHRGDVLTIARGVDCVVIAVAHPEYALLPWRQLRDALRHAILVDGRNALATRKRDISGFDHRLLGRGVTRHSNSD